ncbi:hypothetical protein BD324DRAFT_622139 [Kockovaella imperatae]|uniref:Uncharacterized protein n=1 Tax=Kockovaella imperatae TaxID=4999 RepID=A0A1Y1UNN0_9TREE|nr:hypothetical protein BD324DRAFT_622139 [Kockovaella imperatae]ORX38735.1 hypothetical protein BD324DRAFT_622139 [Kockovaella imperatae]
MRVSKRALVRLVLTWVHLQEVLAHPIRQDEEEAQWHKKSWQKTKRSVGDPGMLDVYIVTLADGADLTAHLTWLSGEFDT